jgi:hypothetical protein
MPWASCIDHFTPRGKSPRYPLDRRLSGPQSRSGGGDEKKNPGLCRESNAGSPGRSLVAKSNELPRYLSCELIRWWRKSTDAGLWWFWVLLPKNQWLAQSVIYPIKSRSSELWQCVMRWRDSNVSRWPRCLHLYPKDGSNTVLRFHSFLLLMLHNHNIWYIVV